MFDNTKRVLIIDNIKNSNIQQAIFILKDRDHTIKDFDVLDEANNIIYQYIMQSERPVGRDVKKKKRFFGKGKHKA